MNKMTGRLEKEIKELDKIKKKINNLPPVIVAPRTGCVD